MKNAPLKSARRRGLWKWGQAIRLAHSPTAEQNQKKRTNHVLPKPDNFIRYRQSKTGTAEAVGCTLVGLVLWLFKSGDVLMAVYVLMSELI
jgi:hypothetical protein